MLSNNVQNPLTGNNHHNMATLVTTQTLMNISHEVQNHNSKWSPSNKASNTFFLYRCMTTERNRHIFTTAIWAAIVYDFKGPTDQFLLTALLITTALFNLCYSVRELVSHLNTLPVCVWGSLRRTAPRQGLPAYIRVFSVMHFSCGLPPSTLWKYN
jgi:hypothetical protein